MTESGKSPKRANKLLAAVGTLSVSLGMTVWTGPIDGAGPAMAHIKGESVTQDTIKHNAVKIDNMKYSKYSAGFMANHKDEAGTGSQTSLKYEQNSVKAGNQDMWKWHTQQNSLKPGVQNSVKAKNWGGSAGGDNPQE